LSLLPAGESTFNAVYAQGAAMRFSDAAAEGIAYATRMAGFPAVDSVDVNGSSPNPSTLKLTPRELDVVRLLVEGYTDEEIARVLGISRRTVSDRIGDLLRTFRLPNRTALAVYAVRNRIV
jgi:DNA-binding NarL/FixJ family response regulator